MIKTTTTLLTLLTFGLCISLQSQIVINEGSNKNYTQVTDEDGENPDWIELYNAGSETVDLFGYTLSDDPSNPQMWTMPHYFMDPGTYLIIHCSGKDRYATTPSTMVVNTGTFIPQAGWNVHEFTTPFEWDGYSNVVVNTCSFSSLGYTYNSVCNSTYTDYNSVIATWADGSPAACGSATGENSNLRPNMMLNDVVIGEDIVQNCNTCYPAPYGNWYWGARNQMIIRADELFAAGLSAGPITSLAFDIAYPDPQTYDYIEISMNNTSTSEFNGMFMNNNGYFFHSNFKLSSSGDQVYLYTPDQTLVSTLVVGGDTYDLSNGLYPDGSNLNVLFQPATPGETNNNSEPANAYALAPIISVTSGFYSAPFTVTISNPNGPASAVYYTTDGSYPTTSSLLYDGTPIQIYTTKTIRARAFEAQHIASEPAVATYFFNVNHVTPILSVTTDNANLYGATGIFDNYNNDWLKEAYVEYFDSIPTHPLLFSQKSGMIQDGGWGGSRSQPQHSFRLELANGILGDEPMHYPVIPDRPYRNDFSDFYLRNGSNQYLVLPYKDASQVRMMAKETHGYYSSYRPISVYINGQYFGLYELREKFNKEYFEVIDNATPATIEIMSLSAFYGFILRAVEGNLDNYINSYTSFMALDPAAPDFWDQADQHFDLQYYTDYIIGENWMGNVDWPGNNIKIYRSDATDYRWRFCTIDLELALQPNSWTDCTTDHMAYILSQGLGNPFTNVFNVGINNTQFKNYFVNRYADIMNTAYKTEHLLAIEQNYFNLTVTEMQNEYQRWADPWNVPAYIEAFYNNHMTFQADLACRTENVRNHIQNNLGLNGQVSVHLDVYPAGAGSIQINTIVPESLPWQGVYFDGVPVTVTAIPNPGYSFDHWLSDLIVTSPFTDSVMTLNVDLNDNFTAYFNGAPVATQIAISEINYNSDNTHNSGDWFELHNYGTTPVDLTGWKVTNEINLPAFLLPAGTVLHPDEYLVIARDMNLFQAAYPDVANVIGPFIFSLNGSGGAVKLWRNTGDPLVTVNYDDIPDWPLIADGGGRTLELAQDNANPNSPQSWFAGCMFGSPGEGYSPCPETVMFTEINYNSASNADGGNWVEIRNTGETAMDISNWIFRDSDDNSLFQIPANTVLDAGEMLVLNNDNTLFEAQYPEVNNHVGPFNFNLSNTGEFIRLYNDQDKLYFSMAYSSSAPWASTPNGGGYTLELIDSSANVNAASNWMAGCLHGSPGVYYTPCNTIDVNEKTKNTSLLIYPNPTNGMAYVITSGPCLPGDRIQIVDSFGRMIEEQYVKNSQSYFEFNMSSYAAGWYLVRVITDNGIQVKKIIVEK